ncbi:MAG: hypothetical protein K0R26_1332 [Bacteroidota bacterium]|jgi:hypothetical protein|nr:hypothetical protein [Bacteroidota bacterium]
MSFWQRFRLFLIGFVPGCIILFFIVKKTGCTSPNELKMLELQHQYLVLGDKAACKLKCLVMIDKGFKVNMRNFQVNYDLSDVHRKPYGMYYLQAKNAKDARYEFIAEDKDTVTFVSDIKLLQNSGNCSCDILH